MLYARVIIKYRRQTNPSTNNINK